MSLENKKDHQYQILSSLADTLQSEAKEIRSIFYPGCGGDYRILFDLLDWTDATSIFYVDYGPKEEIINALYKNISQSDWEITSFIPLRPEFLHQASWENYWYNLTTATEFSNPSPGYAYRVSILNKFSEKSVTLFFFGTEAIKTYQLVCRHLSIPDLVLLVDHGTGGNWSRYGYREEDPANNHLFNVCLQNDIFPSYVLASNITPSWPNYMQMSLYSGEYGSAKHTRALFKRVMSLPNGFP